MDIPKHPFFDECDFNLVGQKVICPTDFPAHGKLVEVLTRPIKGTNGDAIFPDVEAFFKDLDAFPEASVQYDLWVLSQVQQLPRQFKYLVNLSANTLQYPGFLYYLNHTQFFFHFEISEKHQGIYSDDTLYLIELLSKRHYFYLDDFGVGSANLLNLELLAPHLIGVKIDAGLILRIHQVESQVIVGSLFVMLENLSLMAIAEGVETLEIYNILQQIKNKLAPNLILCFQGWLWGKPDQLYPPIS